MKSWQLLTVLLTGLCCTVTIYRSRRDLGKSNLLFVSVSIIIIIVYKNIGAVLSVPRGSILLPKSVRSYTWSVLVGKQPS